MHSLACSVSAEEPEESSVVIHLVRSPLYNAFRTSRRSRACLLRRLKKHSLALRQRLTPCGFVAEGTAALAAQIQYFSPLVLFLSVLPPSLTFSVWMLSFTFSLCFHLCLSVPLSSRCLSLSPSSRTLSLYMLSFTLYLLFSPFFSFRSLFASIRTFHFVNGESINTTCSATRSVIGRKNRSLNLGGSCRACERNKRRRSKQRWSDTSSWLHNALKRHRRRCGHNTRQ